MNTTNNVRSKLNEYNSNKVTSKTTKNVNKKDLSLKGSYNNSLYKERNTPNNDYSKNIYKTGFSPIQEKNYSTKKSTFNIKPIVVPLDLAGLFMNEFEEVRDATEKALTSLNIKCFLTGTSNYRCEKNSIKFELNITALSRLVSENGYCVNIKKKQGNNLPYKEIVNNIYKRINEDILQSK